MKHPARLVVNVVMAITLLASLGLQAADDAQAAPAGGPTISQGPPLTQPGNSSTKDLWREVAGTPAPARPGAKPNVRPGRFRGLRLDRAGMAGLLPKAPRERTQAAQSQPLVVLLPAPAGGFQRFALEESAIMAPGMAVRHPEIRTYAGLGIDDPAATSTHTSSRRVTEPPLPGRATRLCAMTTRPPTHPPAMFCGRTGSP